MISFEELKLEVSSDNDRETNSLGVSVNIGDEKQNGESREEAGKQSDRSDNSTPRYTAHRIDSRCSPNTCMKFSEHYSQYSKLKTICMSINNRMDK